MGKTGTYALYGVGGLLAVALVAKFAGSYDVFANFGSHPDDASPSTRNPWRGTGKPCEANFDSLPTAKKAEVVTLFDGSPATSKIHMALVECKPK